ncbi:hypothetical protein mRhiFer1_008107 [Rhinolophus ferrumequinum]|uniref:Uncharacterized protein n=1 Tax=Rhinolophus ferrumequinum TaxID=59479 RepID=A0A7J7W7Y3_RHIFE|nr:hypothetical protein mRhiFer1_008107 [Rhinolophus ferrumequinum]
MAALMMWDFGEVGTPWGRGGIGGVAVKGLGTPLGPSWSLGPARLLCRNKAPSTSVPWDQALCLQYLSLTEIRPFPFPNVPSLSLCVFFDCQHWAQSPARGCWRLGPTGSQPAFPLRALCRPQEHSLPLACPIPVPLPPLASQVSSTQLSEDSKPSEKSRMASGPYLTFLYLGYIHGCLFPSMFSTCATPCCPFSELGDS